jgi:hypothetical protein
VLKVALGQAWLGWSVLLPAPTGLAQDDARAAVRTSAALESSKQQAAAPSQETRCFCLTTLIKKTTTKQPNQKRSIPWERIRVEDLELVTTCGGGGLGGGAAFGGSVGRAKGSSSGCPFAMMGEKKVQ